MAKRTLPPKPQLANIQPAQIPSAIKKLERRIDELKSASPSSKEELSSVIDSLCTKVNNSLAEVFGLDTVEYERAHVGQTRFHVMRVLYSEQEIPFSKRLAEFDEGRSRTISALQSEIELLKERLDDLDNDPPFLRLDQVDQASPESSTTEIFVVHGQDNAAREEVARFLEKAGLDPIILHEQANEGKTVIEKFERHSASINFAVVLLTPDDVGGPVGGLMRPRARQNVIAELFYFMGKLGRSRVCALQKGELEIPSEIAGLVYTPLDTGGGWKAALLRELENAGYRIRWDALR